MPNNLILRQVHETLIIEIPLGRLRLQKQSEQCRRTAGKINIHEISNYQLSKDQLNNTVMYDIKQQITCLLNEFNQQNNSGVKSAHTNNSIKENIIKLKKKVKTSESLHAYYKILLKERKLDHFHIHVNQPTKV